ncbi:YtxH domain-containing protein [Lacinutrix salivirga]
MSDDKNLSEDLDDMLDNAKEGAKKAGDKAKEFGNDAKEAASDFADDVKDSAKEFSEDAKAVLSDGKNVAIIAHITLIGWIIAMVMNQNEKKTELGSFYIRQTLGIFLLGFLSIIPLLGILIALLCFVMWIMSLVGALSGEKKPVFLLGDKFQDWFKSI